MIGGTCCAKPFVQVAFGQRIPPVPSLSVPALHNGSLTADNALGAASLSHRSAVAASAGIPGRDSFGDAPERARRRWTDTDGSVYAASSHARDVAARALWAIAASGSELVALARARSPIRMQHLLSTALTVPGRWSFLARPRRSGISARDVMAHRARASARHCV